MKLRKLRRTRVRHWDAVHSSWSGVIEAALMWPIRKIKGCRTYSAWCSDCNAGRFVRDTGRYPYTYDEFAAFEDARQGEAEP